MVNCYNKLLTLSQLKDLYCQCYYIESFLLKNSNHLTKALKRFAVHESNSAQKVGTEAASKLS